MTTILLNLHGYPAQPQADWHRRMLADPNASPLDSREIAQDLLTERMSERLDQLKLMDLVEFLHKAHDRHVIDGGGQFIASRSEVSLQFDIDRENLTDLALLNMDAVAPEEF
jgi:hypothetical protein